MRTRSQKCLTGTQNAVRLRVKIEVIPYKYGMQKRKERRSQRDSIRFVVVWDRLSKRVRKEFDRLVDL